MPASTTQIRHFSSTPETTLSDHKPVHAILELPPATHNSQAPHLAPVLPEAPPPHRKRPEPTPSEQLIAFKALGWALNTLIGWPWCLFVALGGGNTRTGMGVSAFLTMIWGVWWSGFLSGSYST